MKEIKFKITSDDGPSLLLLVFNSHQEALDALYGAIINCGTENYESEFIFENETMTLKLKGSNGKSLMYPPLKYDKNQYYLFTQIPDNKLAYAIMYGFMDSHNFVSASYNSLSYVQVKGYHHVQL